MTSSNIAKVTELTVFETADGGRTIYSRKHHSETRTLHYKDPTLQRELEQLENKKRWGEIFESRHNNTALNDLCNQVEVLYELSKKHT